MLLPRKSTNDDNLVKHNLAVALQEEIIRGNLLPGERIVEGAWGRKYGVAQASVREAINILIADGFATKKSGRSARVTQYSEQDVARIYELRGALEGLAARLIVERKANLAPLEHALGEMAKAGASGDMRELVETDVRFHLALCELSGNPFLFASLRRVLKPLFAFALMRNIQTHQTPEPWRNDIDYHQRIIDFLREGDSTLAENYIRHVMGKFASRAYAIWENKHGSERRAPVRTA
jgi:DNA-binding GntR family transcriptional regulator